MRLRLGTGRQAHDEELPRSSVAAVAASVDRQDDGELVVLDAEEAILRRVTWSMAAAIARSVSSPALRPSRSLTSRRSSRSRSTRRRALRTLRSPQAIADVLLEGELACPGRSGASRRAGIATRVVLRPPAASRVARSGRAVRLPCARGRGRRTCGHEAGRQWPGCPGPPASPAPARWPRAHPGARLRPGRPGRWDRAVSAQELRSGGESWGRSCWFGCGTRRLRMGVQRESSVSARRWVVSRYRYRAPGPPGLRCHLCAPPRSSPC